MDIPVDPYRFISVNFLHPWFLFRLLLAAFNLLKVLSWTGTIYIFRGHTNLRVSRGCINFRHFEFAYRESHSSVFFFNCWVPIVYRFHGPTRRFRYGPGPPKVYMYGPAASPLGRSYAVDCSAWRLRNGESAEKQQLVEQVLEKLRRNLGSSHCFFWKWLAHSGKKNSWLENGCIFYWKLGYSIAMLVCQRVAVCDEIFLQWVNWSGSWYFNYHILLWMGKTLLEDPLVTDFQYHWVRSADFLFQCQTSQVFSETKDLGKCT